MIFIAMIPESVYNMEEHVKILQDALQKQVEDMQNARDSFLRQGQPATATWGMANYERSWGLVIDNSKPLDQRLAAYRAKRRGVGTTTAETIRSIAEGFYNGQVEVAEHKKEFWFEVIFTSQIGIPPNMADLKAAVEDIKPAHMEAVYVIVRNTNDILGGRRHDDLAAYNHDDLKTVNLQ